MTENNKAQNKQQEWPQHRNAMIHADNSLIKIRLLAVIFFTFFFLYAPSAFHENSWHGMPGHLISFPYLALVLFTGLFYFLDTYYEKKRRLTALRTLQWEGQSENNGSQSKDLKADFFSNFFYGLMFFLIFLKHLYLISYLPLSLYGILTLVFSASLACGLVYYRYFQFKEIKRQIRQFSDIANSPVIFSKDEIETATAQISNEVVKWLRQTQSESLQVISVLTGARPFCSLLLKNIRQELPAISLSLIPLRVEVTQNDTLKDHAQIIYGNHYTLSAEKPVLIVDDLVDSGTTLELLKNEATKLGAANVRTTVLINKYRTGKYVADFTGLDLALEKDKLKQKGVKDYWLFGFGMDINGSYRELDYVGWIARKIKQ